MRQSLEADRLISLTSVTLLLISLAFFSTVVCNIQNFFSFLTHNIQAAASNQQGPISSQLRPHLAAAASSHGFLPLFFSSWHLLSRVPPTSLSACSWNPQKFFRCDCESHPLEAGEMDKPDFELKTCCQRTRTQSRQAALEKRNLKCVLFNQREELSVCYKG